MDKDGINRHKDKFGKFTTKNQTDKPIKKIYISLLTPSKIIELIKQYLKQDKDDKDDKENQSLMFLYQCLQKIGYKGHKDIISMRNLILDLNFKVMMKAMTVSQEFLDKHPTKYLTIRLMKHFFMLLLATTLYEGKYELELSDNPIKAEKLTFDAMEKNRDKDFKI